MSFSQAEIKQTIPSHLHQFIAEQDYARYTPQDQAVWRYVMKLLVNHLSVHAHPAYVEGLEKTGISTAYIPSIDEMNECLGKLGWRAVVVDGFIPPAVFMEFQEQKILPIALEMRTFAHMLYTPAPDIVHESAGHAPFIVDIDYAEFLQKFGEIGAKAMSTMADFEVYEAIRHLSIVKEYPNATVAEIEAAEADLAEKVAANTELSEAALLARLHWWTVEYGLVGDTDDYRIFGAGILSSLGESTSCLDDSTVKKIPLTVDAINTAYDITTEQPQLFVTKSCKHLSQVLEEFANSMCFRKGGAESVQVAIDCATISTAEYSSGLQVSGVFTKLVTNAVGTETYIGTTGPTQLAFNNKELEGHGIAYHEHGFGSPVGRVKDMFRSLEDCSVDELKLAGISRGENSTIEFLSGVTVQGVLTNILRVGNKNLVLTFEQCTVTGPAGEILFDPSWGVYDMAVGDGISSVFAGSADKSTFEIYKQKSQENAIEVVHSAEEKELFALFEELSTMRENGADASRLTQIAVQVRQQFADDWLIRMELLELLDPSHAAVPELKADLARLQADSAENNMLITLGLAQLNAAEAV